MLLDKNSIENDMENIRKMEFTKIYYTYTDGFGNYRAIGALRELKDLDELQEIVKNSNKWFDLFVNEDKELIIRRLDNMYGSVN